MVSAETDGLIYQASFISVCLMFVSREGSRTNSYPPVMRAHESKMPNFTANLIQVDVTTIRTPQEP